MLASPPQRAASPFSHVELGSPRPVCPRRITVVGRRSDQAGWISDYGYDETLHGFEKSAGKLGVAQIDLLILAQSWSPIGGITFYRDSGHTSTLQDPDIVGIAETHGKSPAQVMLRWGLQHGRLIIPKSIKPHRIAENLDVFDFTLTDDELHAIDALDTGKRGGPEPDAITLEAFGRAIPDA